MSFVVENLPASYLLASAEPGVCLPDRIRLRMERAFGSCFSDVRLHAGNFVTEHGALAVTLGNHVFVSPQLLEPDTPRGRALIAHELVHVLQQRASRLQFVQGRGALAAISNAAELEEEALRIGKAACLAEARNVMPVVCSDSSYKMVAPQRIDMVPVWASKTVRGSTAEVLISVTALLRHDNMNTGSGPNPNLRPLGFVRGDCPHHHQRGHMIGNNLGGSGQTLENLVTLTEGTNHPFMYEYEESVRKYVGSHMGSSFVYEVQAVYDEGKYLRVERPVPQNAVAGSTHGACGNPYCDFPCPAELHLHFKETLTPTYPLAHLIPLGSRVGNAAGILNGIYKFHNVSTRHVAGQCWAVSVT